MLLALRLRGLGLMRVRNSDLSDNLRFRTLFDGYGPSYQAGLFGLH